MTTAKIPPKPSKDTVYIDVDDEITSIIDKVDGAKQKVVALVLPKRATALQSIVNMRLLKRNADKAGKSVVLITGEEALLPLAGAAGLHVAKNLQSKPEIPAAPAAAAAKAGADEPPEDIDTSEEEPSTKLDYHRSVGELAAVAAVGAAAGGAESDAAIALEDDDGQPEESAEETKQSKKEKKAQAAKEKKLKVPNFDRFRVLLFGGIGLLILLAVFIYLAVAVLPKATITITTGSTPVSANMTINASDANKAVDLKNNAIPATLETTKQTSTVTVPATGQQNNGTKATGSVTMSAGSCSANFPNDIGAGTGVSTNGLTYITQEDASFSAHNSGGKCVFESNSVAIAAQVGGSKYNTSISGASVSGAPGVTADGSASGGTDNVITVVSQSDLNNAASKQTDSATATFTKNWTDGLAKQDLYVFTSTLKPGTPATTANPALGQQATNTTVTTVTSYTVLAVKKTDFTAVIEENLKKQVDPSKQKLSGGDVLTVATISIESQPTPSSANVNVKIDTTAVPIINEEHIKQQASGHKVADIKAAASGVPGVEKVDVKLSPFWVSKAPEPSKITLVQQQVKK